MGQTSRGYRYPEIVDSPHVPQAMQRLAVDVDTDAAAQWARQVAVDADFDVLEAPYACLVRHNANQSVPNGAWTPIVYHEDIFDPHDWHDTSTNRTRITPSLSGLYLVFAHVDFSASNLTGNRGIELYRSDGTIWAKTEFAAPGSSTAAKCPYATAIIPVTSGQFLEAWGYQNSGAALSTTIFDSGGFFGALRLAA